MSDGEIDWVCWEVTCGLLESLNPAAPLKPAPVPPLAHGVSALPRLRVRGWFLGRSSQKRRFNLEFECDTVVEIVK